MAPDQQAPDIRAARSPWQHDERLRVITDALPVGIAYVDQDKIYRFTNDRFAAAYGLSREEILGKHADEFIWRDAMTLGDPFFEAAHRGHPVDFTHPVRHADGRLLSVRTFLRPDIVADGSVAGFYVCSINVTQQKEAEIAVLQAQKMDAVGQLASGIAHDFNNLLAIMLGNLVPLREVLADEAVVKEYVDPAVRAAEHGARLTAQLLAVARRQPLQPEPVDVADRVRDLLNLLRRTFPSSIELTVAARGEPVPAYLDRAQFETALLNLCINARDAMPEGGQIRIEIDYPDPSLETARGEGALIGLSIVDTGQGMDESTAAHVFEPFFTTKGHGKGTGLGLSMVYGFVRQSHGSITVASTPGEGTCFTLRLPVSTARQPPRPEPETVAHGDGLVLLVEDNLDLRRTLRRELAGAGYQVIEAATGEEAMDLVRALGGLRAVVSDVVMPGMSGFRLAREAAALRPGLHIVLMTGFAGADQNDREDAAFPMLQKPFEPGELIRAIEGRRG